MDTHRSPIPADRAGRLRLKHSTHVVARVFRFVTVVCVVSFALGAASRANADPPPPDLPSPFPSIIYYQQLDAESFSVPNNDGVWFTTPTGQNCGIWGWGSFGCAGIIPGAPPGTNHIGWIDGDRAVHYDWSVGVRFPGTQAQQPLPPHSFIEYQGTTCAETRDSRTYCERGPLRFVIEPAKTWLSAPWMDLSWMQLGPA